MTPAQSNPETDVELPCTPPPKHNPTTTKWEIRNERAALGLDKTTRVVPVSSLSSTLFDDDDTATRVATRGRPWMVHSPTRSDGGSLKLAGEAGHLRINVQDDDTIAELEDIGEDHDADDSGERPILITGLLRTPDWPNNDYIFDDQSQFVAFENDQRRGLLSLSMVDSWPRVYDKRDADPDTVERVLQRRADALHDTLRAQYGDTVSVSVRHRDREVHQHQLQIIVSFNQLLLPQDIAYVYREMDAVDGINYASDGRGGTYFEGLRYRVSEYNL